MDPLRVLIADKSEDFCKMLYYSLQEKYHTCICTDGVEAVSIMQRFLPDIVIMDLMLPQINGKYLLQAALGNAVKPSIIITAGYLGNDEVYLAASTGIESVFWKPCSLNAVIERIEELASRRNQRLYEVPDLRTETSNILLSLNVAAKLRGYRCVREAILIKVRDPEQSATKELYPAVAAVCGGSATQAERAIRSAIQAAWENRDEEIWRLYFKPDGNGCIPRPTNGAFISTLAEQLSLRYDFKNVRATG